jgi:hypothetical protein
MGAHIELILAKEQLLATEDTEVHRGAATVGNIGKPGVPPSPSVSSNHHVSVKLRSYL